MWVLLRNVGTLHFRRSARCLLPQALKHRTLHANKPGICTLGLKPVVRNIEQLTWMGITQHRLLICGFQCLKTTSTIPEAMVC